MIKSLRENTRDKCKLEMISLEKWKAYYKELLTEERQQFQMSSEIKEELNKDATKPVKIDSTEVKQIAKTFKN